ncbi:21368_t:CDS:2, partial [Gigaspora margarita]
KMKSVAKIIRKVTNLLIKNLSEYLILEIILNIFQLEMFLIIGLANSDDSEFIIQELSINLWAKNLKLESLTIERNITVQATLVPTQSKPLKEIVDLLTKMAISNNSKFDEVCESEIISTDITLILTWVIYFQFYQQKNCLTIK